MPGSGRGGRTIMIVLAVVIILGLLVSLAGAPVAGGR